MNSDVVSAIADHVKAAQELAASIGVNNLFYNEHYVELLMASALGHRLTASVRGHDATDESGKSVEYKSINVASKHGGSFQFHWLSKEKLRDYAEVSDVFFCIRNGTELIEIWKLPMSSIYSDLSCKFKDAESRRLILERGGVSKTKNIDAHKSYTLAKIKTLGAEKVYGAH